MKKVVIAAILVLSVATATLVFAQATNWFQVAHVTGIIVQSQTGTVQATINLGAIASASDFSASGSGTITIAETGGLNTTMFILGPGALTNIQFYNLYINVTIDQNKQFIPLIENGVYGNFPGTGYGGYNYWPGWNTVYLSQGTHTITFDVYGTTQIVNQNTNIDFTCQIELQP